MKVKFSSVNKYTMSDKALTIMIDKKPKQRYRTIIRSYYKWGRKRNKTND